MYRDFDPYNGQNCRKVIPSQAYGDYGRAQGDGSFQQALGQPGITSQTSLRQELTYSSGPSGAPFQKHSGPPAFPSQPFSGYGRAQGGSIQQAFGQPGTASHTSLRQELSYSSGPSGAPFQKHSGPPVNPSQPFNDYGRAPGGSFQQNFGQQAISSQPFSDYGRAPGGSFQQAFGQQGIPPQSFGEFGGAPGGSSQQRALVPTGMSSSSYSGNMYPQSSGSAAPPFQQTFGASGHHNSSFETREVLTDGYGARYERQVRFNATSAQPGYDESPRLMAPRSNAYSTEKSSEESSSSSEEESDDGSEDSDDDSTVTISESDDSDDDSRPRKSSHKHGSSRGLSSLSITFGGLHVSGKNKKKKKRSY